MRPDDLARWRALGRRYRDDGPLRGLDALWDRGIGALRRVRVRAGRFLSQAARVLALEPSVAAVSDSALRGAAAELRERLGRGRETPAELERACAVVREVARRRMGMLPHAEQIAGALAMHAGAVAEMATGEGKTLTAVFPAVFAAWRGRGCHVVTANEYLARRDAEGMASVYAFLGLRVAHIGSESPAPERREAYGADVTYVSNKDVAADFLRDRLALGRKGGLVAVLLDQLRGTPRRSSDRMVQRGLESAIVDEADSILVDEAVTPLLISTEAPNPGQEEAVLEAGRLAEALEPPRDYRFDGRRREVALTGPGRDRLAVLAAPLGGLWTGTRRREELVVQALTARHCYHRDLHYVVQGDEVVIVDEFTGRLMPDRTWRHGLHEAVEAKERVPVNLPKDTVARISFQRFFRLYRRLCGMTGTAWEARGQLWHVYRLPIAVIPVHRPCRRAMGRDRVYATSEARWRAVVDAARRVHETGRPLLVGTRSIGASLRLSEMLSAAGVEHSVLNGVQDADEADVVARAGERGAVTVATNMAGRGTDIRLAAGVAELGGLAVFATERHEAGRIDRQLFGRSARQGDPGSAQVFASLEDDLLRRYAPVRARAIRLLPTWRGRVLAGFLARSALALAQRRAERTAERLRRAVLAHDQQFDEMLGFTGDGR